MEKQVVEEAQNFAGMIMDKYTMPQQNKIIHNICAIIAKARNEQMEELNTKKQEIAMSAEEFAAMLKG